MDCSPPGSSVHGILQAECEGKVKVAHSCPTLCDPMDPMEFFMPEYWSGSLSLLQGIFPTQGWNPGLPHCRRILYQLSHKGSLSHQGSPQRDIQIRSVAQSCPTLCDPMNRSTPGLPVHHQLPEFTQTHVHQVGDGIQPSHPLSSPSPPAPNPSQHQGLFQ